MTANPATRWTLVAVACGLALVLLASLLTPAVSGSGSTQAVLGKAGFAYLGGLRTFVAALLWNRLDPQSDGYYSGQSVEQQTFMLPTLRVVTWLDPQFVQAYYIAQWITARDKHLDQSLALTREGLANNPKSGLLMATYAQLLQLFAHDQKAAALWAERALAPGIQWRDDTEKFDSYVLIQAILKASGDTAGYEAAHAEWKRLKDEGTQPGSGPSTKLPGIQPPATVPQQ